jgi:hypothetical protein
MKAYGGVDVYIDALLSLALRGRERSSSRPGRFTFEDGAPGAYWIGGCLGPSGGLDAVAKKKVPLFLLPWNEPRLFNS